MSKTPETCLSCNKQVMEYITDYLATGTIYCKPCYEYMENEVFAYKPGIDGPPPITKTAKSKLFNRSYTSPMSNTPKGRATTPEQRANIIKMIEVAWNRCPSLRLGQLLDNAHKGDIFYVEDEDLGRDVAQYAHQHSNS